MKRESLVFYHRDLIIALFIYNIVA